MTEYWYNVKTGQVEEDRNSPGADLMGPYATYEEASHALEIARRKTEEWDAAEAAEQD